MKSAFGFLLAVLLCAAPALAQEAGPGMAPHSIPSVSPEVMGQLPADVQGLVGQVQSGSMSPEQAAGHLSPEQIQQLQQAAPEGMEFPGFNEPESGSSDPGDSGADVEDSAGIRSAAVYSLIETIYRKNYGSGLSRDLRQFGYDLFSSGSLKPSNLAVPSGDYVLGPGDQMRIRLWGSGLDAEFKGYVAKDGTINVPRIGIVPVAGVRMNQVEGIILQEAEKYVQGINISVSLEQLRSVEVYVMGSVKRPGLHMAPAFSTVLGGLMAGGGVQKAGSLRTIEVYRNGSLHKTVDLYELLLKGNREADILLEDRDVIFVPRIGRTAAMAGAVAQESIFELKDERTVDDLLRLSGGVLPQSFTGRIYLRRYDSNSSFVVRDIDAFARGEEMRAVQLENGDLVELQFLSPAWPSAVHLTGHVWMPDIFQHTAGLKLSSVLTSRELLKPDAVTDYGLLYRYDKASTRFTVRKFPLAQVFDGSYDQELRPHDRVVILSLEQFGIHEAVEIRGAVWKPGGYSYRPGMKLSDLLGLSGGVKKDEAVTEFAYLYRYNPAILDFEVRRIDFRQILEGEADIELSSSDVVRVMNRKEFDVDYKVNVSGAVKGPGGFSFHQGMTLRDAVTLAGGPLYGAHTGRVEVSRQYIRTDRVETEHITVDLQREAGFALQPFDYVFVPRVKDATAMKTVTVGGEVRYPGEYRIRDGEKLSDLIARAGGYTEHSYLYGARFTSPRARAIQKRSIESLIQDLEARASTVMAGQAQTALDSEDVASVRVAQEGMRQFIQKLKTIEPEGRVAIKLADLASFKGSAYDFTLEDGDSLVIPKQPNFVAVVGSVYTPTAFLHKNNQTVRDYLKLSGGPTKSADQKYIYVLKANGEVVSKAQSNAMGRFESMRLMPGDTVVVPENLERVPYLRMVRDITDIVFKIATTAGIAIAVL